MASCAFCDTSILFGGATANGKRYCNNECAQRGMLLDMADRFPRDVVDEHVNSVHRGACPLCSGPGPIDVHRSYRVWSALVLTSWATRPSVCCRSCGQKRRGLDLAFSLALGWWGFPWGLLMTPIQVIRNAVGLLSPPKDDRPTPELARMVKLHLAQSVLQRQQADPSP